MALTQPPGGRRGPFQSHQPDVNILCDGADYPLVDSLSSAMRPESHASKPLANRGLEERCSHNSVMAHGEI